MSAEFEAGKPVSIGMGAVPVHRLVCGNPGPLTGPGTNSYLIGERTLALVDPGPADDAHIHAIMQTIGGRSLRWIFVTHTHGDHSPGAAVLRELTGAELVGRPAPDAGYQDQSFVPDRHYEDGERIESDEYSVTLLHTPGHVSNHLCFLLEHENMLFTGDHILEGTTSVILPPDGNMAHYLQSLEQLRELPLRSLAPGHGRLMEDPHQVITTLIRHRLRREQKVVTALDALGAVEMDRLVLRVYDDVAEHLLPWARKTLLAHLIKLSDEGRAVQRNDRWQLL